MPQLPRHSPPQPSLLPHAAPGKHTGWQSHWPVPALQAYPLGHTEPVHVPPHPLDTVSPHARSAGQLGVQHAPLWHVWPPGHFVPVPVHPNPHALTRGSPHITVFAAGHDDAVHTQFPPEHVSPGSHLVPVPQLAKPQLLSRGSPHATVLAA